MDRIQIQTDRTTGGFHQKRKLKPMNVRKILSPITLLITTAGGLRLFSAAKVKYSRKKSFTNLDETNLLANFISNDISFHTSPPDCVSRETKTCFRCVKPFCLSELPFCPFLIRSNRVKLKHQPDLKISPMSAIFFNLLLKRLDGIAYYQLCPCSHLRNVRPV